MSKLVIGSIGTKGNGGSLIIGGNSDISSVPDTTKNNSFSLSEQLQKTQNNAAHKQKPLLVYLMVDLTSSREGTRDTMRSHEQSLAKLIMDAGGDHLVVCKGVYHSGGRCSQAETLVDEDAILRFLDKEPEAGLTNIVSALEQYRDDETEDILSLGVLIGDAADGDSRDSLINMAASLKTKNRPLVIAHQRLNYNESHEFCSSVVPAMTQKGEGLDFSLGSQPKELHALLSNYKKILTATPDDLKATANNRGGIQFIGDSATQRFAHTQANLLLTHD